MTAPDPVALAPMKVRRILPAGLVVAGLVMSVALAAVLFVFPAAPVPSGRLVGWQLHGFAGRGFDPTTTQTTEVVRVAVSQWPTEFEQGDSSWLAMPVIAYTPWSVTITLYSTDAFSKKRMYSWYDTGGWVDVQLTEPLRGRMLFDGSTFPMAVRPYR